MDLRAILMGVGFAAMWSSAFTSARVAVQYAPPVALLSVRFLISGLLAIGIALALKQSARLSRRQWIGVALFGLCQNALYLGLNFIAMQWIEAGLAAIIASLLPLFVAVAGWLFLKDRLPPLGIGGLVLGLVGVTVIMGARVNGETAALGIVLCFIGVIALTTATLLVRGVSNDKNVYMVVGLQMLVGSAVLLPFALLFEDWTVDWSWQLGVAFTYTTLVPGLAATVVWFNLVHRIGATKAASFHFLNPFLGVAIAALFLGEALTARDLFGVAVITAGIWAIQASRRRRVS